MRLLIIAFIVFSTHFLSIAQGSVGYSEYKNIEFNSSTQIVEKSLPPLLELSSVIFLDANHNNRLDANETASINFYIVNKGKGMAKNVKINTTNGTTLITGFSWDQAKTVALIPAGDSAKVAVNLQSNLDLKTGTLTLNINFDEPMGFAPDPLELIIQTKEFNKPNVIVVDQKVLTANGKVGKKQNTILKVLVQNIGQGAAENVNVNFVLPSQGNVTGLGEYNFVFPILEPFEQKEINFEFIISDKYSSKSVPITISISEKYNRFAQGKTCDIAINSITSVPPPVTPQPNIDEPVEIKGPIGSLTSDVDKDIPVNPVNNPNRYALVIGNENYSSRNSGLNSENNVAFAEVDASIFAEYAINTLGVPKENLKLLLNATGSEMNIQIENFTKLLNLSKEKGELIFYYAGHGLPDEATNIPYIVPVDGNYGNLTKSGINLYDMYNAFGSTNAAQILVFMDACFSGGARAASLVAARGVKIKPKKGELKGNIVVFAATSSEQSAMPYAEKKHGLFTYYLLKKFKESKGKFTLDELEGYLSTNVAKQSLLVNQKDQQPEVLVSEKLLEIWQTIKLINY
jgi:hypothetical protein